MHKEILSQDQHNLVPLLKSFAREYYLAGGTAIGLHIGHRRSIDFDLFKPGTIHPRRILDKVGQKGFRYIVSVKTGEQLNLIVQHVKLTFLEFPFPVAADCRMEGIMRLPNLLDLAAMKAYALGRRSKWKDYVDLYFILRDHYSLPQISTRASGIFGQLYSEKMFRAQLSYFKDIDHTEAVDFLVPAPPEPKIKAFLVETALDF